MKRLALAALGTVLGLAAVAHWALIEHAGEVVVLRTTEPDGSRLETRLWIVDNGGVPYLHGGDSDWMRNLTARPIVEVERGGTTRRYRATPVWGGRHPRLHELFRAKYGLADRWVRFIAPDRDTTRAVRLDALD